MSYTDIEKDVFTERAEKFDDFIVAIASKVMSGNELSKISEDALFMLIFQTAFTNNISESDFKIRIKKFRQSVPQFLRSLETVLDNVEKTGKKMYALQNEIVRRADNLPPLANSLDHKEVIEFIQSLDQELYNFSEAEKLLNKPRQTLKSYATKGLHGLTTTRLGKTDYLTKESIVNFYRNSHFDKHGHDLF